MRMYRYNHRLLWLFLLFVASIGGMATLPAQAQDNFSGVYKAWGTSPEGRAIDSTLYLNLDGSLLLVDDPLNGEAALTRTGQWSPSENGVTLTLTGDASGALAEPVLVALDASAGQPLVTMPGDAALGASGRRYYALSYLIENRNALPYSSDFAAATMAANGLAGVYKAIIPGGASGRQELTLTLSPDFRVILERSALDGRAPSLSYGAWQDIGGQAAIILTEADGVVFRAPVEVTFGAENGVLRGLTTASSNAADLVGVPFYRLEGLANAVTVLVPQEVTPPAESTGGAEGEPAALTPAPDATSLPDEATPMTEGQPAMSPPSTEIIAQYEPIFEAAACAAELQFDGGVTCGYLIVPENRSREDSQSLRLFVVKLAAQEDEAPDPLFVLVGPAQEMPAAAQWFATAPVRQTRSVFVVHPRGSGLSEPSLACPEAVAGDDRQLVLQSRADCYNRLLQEGRDLSGYTLDQQAIDVADLATALNLEAINVLGNNLGAAVAQLVAERYPALVRTVTLESPAPVGVNPTLESAFGAHDALRKVFADCNRSNACATAYPDLEVRFLQMIDWYNDNPTPASIGFGDGNAIAALVYDHLRQGGSEIPALIHALYTGDFGTACQIAPVVDGCLLPASAGSAPGADATDSPTAADAASAAPIAPAAPDGEAATTESAGSWRDFFVNPDAPEGAEEAALAQLQNQLGIETRAELIAFLDTLSPQNFLPLLSVTGALPAPATTTQGALLNIRCAEDAPHFTVDDLQRIGCRLPEQVATQLTAPAEELLLICSLWQSAPAARGDRTLSISAAPALIMAGAHDPVTPARWAWRASADFSQPFVRILAGEGHNLLQAPDGCAQEMLAAFVAKAEQGPLPACYLTNRPTFLLPTP